MLQPIDIPVQCLFDGLDSGLYERTFTLPVGGESFSVRDLRSFDELPAEVGEAAFEQVIADAGIQRRAGTYHGADDLPLEFLVRGGCLFVFALGELSAGRYRLTLQGAWRIGPR